MKRFLSIAILLGCICMTGVAQAPYFQRYFLLRKNDPVQIKTILQEKNGFMWFGTSRGLFRFDGKNRQHFTTKDGLALDEITALAEDSLGRIWIGYQNGKVGFLDKDKFQLFEPPEGSSTKPISDILFDKKGNLWYSTLNDGLYYFTSGRLYRVDDAEGLPDLYIYDIAEDARGNIWAGTDGGAAICTLHDTKITIDVIDYTDGLPDNIIRRIVPENDDAVLMATEDAGVIRYDLKTRKHSTLVDHTWEYGPVSDIVIKGNKFWIGCTQNGLLVYDQKTKKEILYKPDEIGNATFIHVMAKDMEGNIWLGTKTGIVRTPGDALQFLEQPVPNGKTNVLAVTVDQLNSIWFSTNDGLFKRKLNSTDVVSKPLANSPYKNYTIISLYADSKGYIWAGLYGEGVLRIHHQTGSIKYLNKELRNGNVLSIAGEGNTVWLGTLGGSTKIEYTDDDKFTVTNFSTADGLASDFIYQVFLENNRVWFSTDGKGLAMMNRDGFHQYDKGLPSAVVYGMAQDIHRRLWVNVQGHGLFTFDGRKFIPADSTLVLRDKNIQCLVSDKEGNIVIMHDAGIDVIDVKKNKVAYLGEEVGVRDKVSNLNATGRDEAGNMYFGTSGGIIQYTSDPAYFINKPKPFLDNISIFDSPINLEASSVLEHDENNLTVHYRGIWYKNPEGIFYSYKLENYDLQWISTTDNSVTYSQLPPGNYTFKVRAAESLDFSDAAEAIVAFSIQPPFWQTTAFYIAAVLVSAGSIYYVVKSRERKLRRYNKVLEVTVNLRTREIQMQNEEIQTQNEEISAQSEEILRINENLEEMVQERTRELERKNKALEEYAFINAHKLRSPVATILGLINLFSKIKLSDEGLEINKRLQQTADELDTVVSSITKAIERGNRKIPKLKDDD